MTFIRFSLFLLILIGKSVFAATFQCEKVFPANLQVKQVELCNTSHIDNLPSPLEIGITPFNNELFASMLKNNNLGGLKILVPGNEKTVYRSAYLVGSPLCIQALAKKGIKTVINLYSGDKGYAEKMHELESTLFKENGIKNYTLINNYRVDVVHQTPDKLNHKIAEIVKKIAKTQGDVLIHCYVGAHDTGVIFGVLNKCFNHQSLKNIEENTICHLGHKTAYEKATYQRVITLIRDFPCKLVDSKT